MHKAPFTIHGLLYIYSWPCSIVNLSQSWCPQTHNWGALVSNANYWWTIYRKTFIFSFFFSKNCRCVLLQSDKFTTKKFKKKKLMVCARRLSLVFWAEKEAAFTRKISTMLFRIFRSVAGWKKIIQKECNAEKNNPKLYSTNQFLSACFQAHIAMLLPPVCVQ